MERRGRKSAVSKTIKLAPDERSVIVEPLKPPPGLDAAGKKRWKQILDELPGDRFRNSDIELLAALIKTEQYVSICEKDIKKLGQVINSPQHGVVANPAIALRDKHLRTIVLLQRSLRLCPLARMRSEDGDLKNVKPTKGGKRGPKKRPWDG